MDEINLSYDTDGGGKATLPETVADVVKNWNFERFNKRYKRLKKVRDQLKGGDEALSQRYHPDPEGLRGELLERIKRYRKHINCVRPAQRWFTGAVYGGIASRQIIENPFKAELQLLVSSYRYHRTMVSLYVQAITYDTAMLVPILTEDRNFKFWIPRPLYSMPIADPDDIETIIGLVELLPGKHGGFAGFRVVAEGVDATFAGGTAGWNGLPTSGKWTSVTPIAQGFLPIVVARGEDLTHEGEVCGESLLDSAADISISVTTNGLRLELLRDAQTQNLLVIQGKPESNATENRENLQKAIMLPDKESDARYESPETKLEDVIKLNGHYLHMLSMMTGLPVDTFLPQDIRGSDASAQASRIRSLPLKQRSKVLLGNQIAVEHEAIEVMTGLLTDRNINGPDAGFDRLPVPYEVIKIDPATYRAEIRIDPIEPMSSQEDVSVWTSRVSNNFTSHEDAVLHFNPTWTENEARDFVAANPFPGRTIPPKTVPDDPSPTEDDTAEAVNPPDLV